MEINLSDESKTVFISAAPADDTEIQKKIDYLAPGTIRYTYLFAETTGERVPVSFNIPNDAINAYVTLNGQKLLGFFSPDIPSDVPLPDAAVRELSFDTDAHVHDTTLAPGRTQKISFRWQKGDELVFYIYKNPE